MAKKKQETKQKYDAQSVFEQAIENRSQTALVNRKDADVFEYLSEWEYQGRKYQVYQLLNAGDSVKVGFMPVKNA